MSKRLLPALDIGLAVLAGAIWYLRPAEGAWPLALIGAAWLLRALAHGTPTRPSPFDVPLVIFLASAFVSATVGYNTDPRWLDSPTPLMWAWGKYWILVAAIALFFAIANLRTTSAVSGAALALMVLAAGAGLYFIATNDWSVRGGKADLLAQVGAWLADPAPEVSGRRLNGNVVGGIIALCMPFGIALWLAARRSKARWLFMSAVLLVAGTGLVLSASRGAWLALAVGLLAWALVHQIASPAGNRSILRISLLALALVSLGVVLASTADLGGVGSMAVNVPAGLSGFGGGTVVGRVEVWQGALRLAQDYLFTGAGLGAASMQISAYDMLIPVLYLPHAHNTFLNVLIEQGIAGGLAFVWLLSAAALAGWRALSTPPPIGVSPLRRLMQEAALASLLVMLMHGLVDDVPYGSRAMLLMFVPFGMLAALSARDEPSSSAIPARVLGVAALVVVGVAIWQRDAVTAQVQANMGALEQARAELANYHIPDRLPETARREGDLDTVMDYYRRALAADPANRTANQRLSMIALARGQYADGLAYATRAAERDAGSATLHILLADASLAAGRSDDAYALWSRIPDAPARLKLTASLRYDKLNDSERSKAAETLAARILAER